jgi:hypothetical protein
MVCLFYRELKEQALRLREYLLDGDGFENFRPKYRTDTSQLFRITR